jgi:hypothetical protein
VKSAGYGTLTVSKAKTRLEAGFLYCSEKWTNFELSCRRMKQDNCLSLRLNLQHDEDGNLLYVNRLTKYRVKL